MADCAPLKNRSFKMKILAFDVGGTKTAYALVNSRGLLESDITTIGTPQNSDAIANIFRQAAKQYKADGLAVATAGVVFHNKVLGKPNNLPIGYETLDFSVLTGLPTIIENDANAAAWAEYKVGVLKNKNQAMILTLGTGVGCGIILNGALYYGKTGAAGEVRYPFAGYDLAKSAQQNGLNESDCFKIYELAHQGQTAALKAYEDWQKSIVSALTEINRLLDLEAVALSGSLSKIVNYIHIEESVNARTYRNPLKILPAKCGQSAGLVGAALLFKEKYHG